MQKVDEADSDAKNNSSAKEFRSLTDQVAKLQKDVEAATKLSKSLQMQIQ
jgi:chromosome segregation ATPase